MKVYIVETCWGSYDTMTREIIAVYATEELANAHQVEATKWRDENLVPMIKRLKSRWDSDLATRLWNAAQNNPWDPCQSQDEDCSYYVYEEEVLDSLPVPRKETK